MTNRITKMLAAIVSLTLVILAVMPAGAAPARFTDVKPGSWYEQAVNWAAQAGVASGYGGGCFGPGDPVTREQLAVFLWHLAGSPAPEDPAQPWADQGDVSPYALQAVD